MRLKTPKLYEHAAAGFTARMRLNTSKLYARMRLKHTAAGFTARMRLKTAKLYEHTAAGFTAN